MDGPATVAPLGRVGGQEGARVPAALASRTLPPSGTAGPPRSGLTFSRTGLLAARPGASSRTARRHRPPRRSECALAGRPLPGCPGDPAGWAGLGRARRGRARFLLRPGCWPRTSEPQLRLFPQEEAGGAGPASPVISEPGARWAGEERSEGCAEAPLSVLRCEGAAGGSDLLIFLLPLRLAEELNLLKMYPKHLFAFETTNDRCVSRETGDGAV